MSLTPSTPRTFTKLGNDVHVSYAQASPTLPVPTAYPSLIVIFGWMDAQLPHILKYAQGYDALFPGVTILIVRSRGAFFLSNHTKRLRSIEPAVKVIQELIDPGVSPAPRILVHTFSNGGCFQLSTVLQALSSKRPPGSTPRTPILPAQLLILDSSPGIGNLTNFTRAFSALVKNPLLRFLFRIILTFFYFLFYSFHTLSSLFHRLILRRPSVSLFDGMLNTLLDPTLLDKKTPRVFIYSKSDDLVDWKDVERYAGRCEMEGVSVVRQRYEKTGHVNHLKGEGEGGKEKYWKTVKDTWDGSYSNAQ